MTHARSQHPNARLTPKHRRNMVDCVLKKGWTIEATAERFQVDAKTVRKWRDRFLEHGEAGLQDRSSRPHRSPNRTPRSCRRRVVQLRKERRWGAAHIAHETGLAASTVQSILRGAGLARLDRGDRAYKVKRLCELTECSRSGYYAWSDRPPCERDVADAELLEEIRTIHSDSRGTYGAPRVHGQLRRRGHRLGCKRVARLMRADGLKGAHVRRKRGRRANVAPGPDLVQRQFRAERPNQVWVADISEFPTGEGKLHVAGVRDLCHRGMVGWAMGPRPDADLVVDAVVMALGRCTPDPDGLVHHSDRGGAYVSFDFCTAVDLAGLQISFGRTGDCYDNAAMETWSIIKREITWIRGSIWFETRDEARLYLFEFIEVFYNRQRHQTVLGHHTPAEFAATFSP